MNKKLKSLAEKSGFLLWEGESWNQGEVIDWSSNYDKEIENLYNNILKECIKVIRQEENFLNCESSIKKHFKIKNSNLDGKEIATELCNSLNSKNESK